MWPGSSENTPPTDQSTNDDRSRRSPLREPDRSRTLSRAPGAADRAVRGLHLVGAGHRVAGDGSRVRDRLRADRAEADRATVHTPLTSSVPDSEDSLIVPLRFDPDCCQSRTKVPGGPAGVNRDGERQPVERSLGLLPAKDQVQHPCLGAAGGTRRRRRRCHRGAPAARRRTDPSPSGSVGTTGSGNRARGPSRALRRRASSCRCPPRPRSAARGVVRSHRGACARRCGSHRSCLRSRATTDHHAKGRSVATIGQSKRARSRRA